MAKIIQPKFPKFDKRLLGVWKSDKRRTFAEWNWGKNKSPIKRARLKSLFGKLIITYTRGKIFSDYTRKKFQKFAQRNFKYTRRYIVLGIDEESAVIAAFGPLKIENGKKYDSENLKIVQELFGSKPRIQHVHFDKKHYWISLGNGRNREFFRKIRNGK